MQMKIHAVSIDTVREEKLYFNKLSRPFRYIYKKMEILCLYEDTC